MKTLLILAALSGCATTHRNTEGELSYTTALAPAGISVLDHTVQLAENANGSTSLWAQTTTRQGSTTIVVGNPGYNPGQIPTSADPRYLASIAASQQYNQPAAPLPALQVGAGGGTTSAPGGVKLPCPADRAPANDAERLSCLEQADDAQRELNLGMLEALGQ